MAEDRDLHGFRDVRNLRFFRLQPTPGPHSLLPVDPLDLYRKRVQRRTRSGPLFERLLRGESVAAKEREQNLRRIQQELSEWRSEGDSVGPFFVIDPALSPPGQETIDDRMAALQGLLQADLLLELERIDKQFGQKYSQRIRQLRGELKKLRSTERSRARSQTASPKPTQRDIQRQVLSTVQEKMRAIVEDAEPLIEKAVLAGVEAGAGAAQTQYEVLFPDGLSTIEEHGDYVISMPDGPGKVDSIKLKNGDLMVTFALLPEEERGKGIGVDMYTRLASYAAEKGVALKSDVSVSEAAHRMYEALERRGFQVTKHPSAKRVGGHWQVPKDAERVPGFESDNPELDTVFRVEAPEMKLSERQQFIDKALAATTKLPTLMSTREKLRINSEIIRGSLIVGEKLPDIGIADPKKYAEYAKDFATVEAWMKRNPRPIGAFNPALMAEHVVKKLSERASRSSRLHYMPERVTEELTQKIKEASEWWYRHKVRVADLKLPDDATIDDVDDIDLSAPIVVDVDGNVLEGYRQAILAKSRNIEELPAAVPAEMFYQQMRDFDEDAGPRAVSLSSRLWKDHKQRGLLMAEQISRTIKAGGTSYDIADEIIGVVDSGEFATAAPDLPVPGYISQMVEAARLANLTGDKNIILKTVQEFEGYVEGLGAEKGLSFSLRSAAKDFLKKIVRAEDDQIDVVLNRFMLDKARIHARMIARTEAVRAYRESYIASVKDKPWVTGIRWKLSHLHPKPDVCDLLANQDLHGLGRGGYPKDQVPPMPHPNDMCLLTGIFNWNYLQEEKDRIRNERDDQAFNMPRQRLTDAQEEALINIVQQEGGLDEAIDALKASRFGAKARKLQVKWADEFLENQDQLFERYQERYASWQKQEPTLENLQGALEELQKELGTGQAPTIEELLKTRREVWMSRMPEARQFRYISDPEKRAAASLKDATRKLHIRGVLPGGTTLDDFPAPFGKAIYVSGDSDLDYDTAIEELKRWHPEPIPDFMETVTVLHATDAATAAKFLKDGIIPQLKPYTLTQLAHRSGQEGVFDARHGLERGLYVGQYESQYQPASEAEDRGSLQETRFAKSQVYQTLKGWNDVLLEIQVPKAWLERPAELEGRLNSDVNEALVRHGIPYTDIRLVHASADLPFFDRFLHGELLNHIEEQPAWESSKEELVEWRKMLDRGWLTHDDFDKLDNMLLQGGNVSVAQAMQPKLWDTVRFLIEVQQHKATKLGADPGYLEDLWNYATMKTQEMSGETLRDMLRVAREVLDSMPLAYWENAESSFGRKAYDDALATYMVREAYPQYKTENLARLNATGRRLRTRLTGTMYSNEYFEEFVDPDRGADVAPWGNVSLGYDRNLERRMDEADADEFNHWVPPLPKYTYEGPIWRHYNVDEAAEIMRRRPHETYVVFETDYFGDEHLVWRQTGERYSVPMLDVARNFQRQHGNTIDMHNHPGGNPPSPPDVMSAMRMNPFQMRIAASNGVDWIMQRPDAQGTGSGWYETPQLGEIYDIQPDGDTNQIDYATQGLHLRLNEAWDKARDQVAMEMVEYIEAKDPGWKAKVKHIKEVAVAEGVISEEKLREQATWGSTVRDLTDVRDRLLPQYKNVPILPVSHPAYDKDVERELLDGFLEKETNEVYADFDLWSVDERSKGFLIKDEPPERIDRARRDRIRYNAHEQGYFDDRLRRPGEELDKSSSGLVRADKRYVPPWNGTLQTARSWAQDILKQEDGRAYMLDLLGPTRFNVFVTASHTGTQGFWGKFLGAVIDDNGVPVPVWEMLRAMESDAEGRRFLDLIRKATPGSEGRRDGVPDQILVPGAVYKTNITRTPRKNLIRRLYQEERWTEDDN